MVHNCINNLAAPYLFTLFKRLSVSWAFPLRSEIVSSSIGIYIYIQILPIWFRFNWNCRLRAVPLQSVESKLGRPLGHREMLLREALRGKLVHSSGGSRPSDKGGPVIQTLRYGRGGGRRFKKIFFLALRVSVWSKIRGGGELYESSCGVSTLVTIHYR